MIRRLSLAAVALLVATVSNTAWAQTCNVETPVSPGTKTCSVGHSLTATVVETAKLTLSSASTAVPIPNVAEYELGEVGFGSQVLGPNAIAKSNKNYTVTFSYPSTFTASSKAASDVQYSVNAGAGTCNATYTTLPAVPAAQARAADGDCVME